MELNFRKYQGAGNDFILCDDRKGTLQQRLDRATIARLCDRHFGIGADGLMLLTATPGKADFGMDYYNSDGNRSTMCGNGGRCIVRYASDLGIERNIYRFVAVDGPHEATITPEGNIALGMNDVNRITEREGDLQLDTGSPHYLRFVDSLDAVDVVSEGRSVRRSPPYRSEGINVNFVARTANGLEIATYERGVEDETLACGTGVTAAAVGSVHRDRAAADGAFHVAVRARGGDLYVTGEKSGDNYTHLQLIGPAEFVFSGTIKI